jgi:hypothetical protein
MLLGAAAIGAILGGSERIEWQSRVSIAIRPDCIKPRADAGMLFPWSGVPVSPVATGPGA